MDVKVDGNILKVFFLQYQIVKRSLGFFYDIAILKLDRNYKNVLQRL